MTRTTKLALVVISTFVLVALAGGLLIQQANAAAPGDTLYSVDRAWEDVVRVFKFSDTARTDYEIDLLAERVEEVEQAETDSKGLDKALENLDEQQLKAQEKIRTYAENDNSDEGELERIRNRYETQTQEHVQKMEQVKQQVAEKGNEQAVESIDKAIENYQKNVETEVQESNQDPVEQNQNGSQVEKGSSQNEDKGR